jgi:hypothetical protein
MLAFGGLYAQFGLVGVMGAGSCLINADIQGLDACEDLQSQGGGGIRQVWFANKSEFIGVTRDADSYITGITLSAGARLYSLRPQEDSAGHSFTYIPASDPAGASKDARFEFRFSVTTPRLSRLIDNLMINRVVVITLEADGRYYISGIGASSGFRGSEGTESSGITADNTRARSVVMTALRSRFDTVRQQVWAAGASPEARDAATASLIASLQVSSPAFVVTQPSSTTVSRATGTAPLTLNFTRGTLTSGVVTATMTGTYPAGVSIANGSSTLTGTTIGLTVTVTPAAVIGTPTVVLRLFGPGGEEDFVNVPLNITA